MVDYPEIKVENIVVSARLNNSVPLEEIAKKLDNVTYNPERFPGAIFKIAEPRASALIFRSGKIVCTGANTLKKVEEALDIIESSLRKIKIDVRRDKEIVVQNIVASSRITNRLKLDSIVYKLENTEYEPEQFPGLILTLENPKTTFLLFGTGKVVCTGAKVKKDVNEAIEKLIKLLKDNGELEGPVKPEESKAPAKK